jgi:ribosomal protein S18 acetylase RimI-like enzyme
MTGEPCRRLEWDSRFFGVEIARVEGGSLDAAGVAAVDRWSADRRIACLYFLADEPGASTACAERAGFRLIDVRVELAHALAPPPDARDSRIRPAVADDVSALRAIARTSHRDSRFYRDERFPRDRCDALYETWIEQSCDGGAAAVLVADVDDRVAGYVTCERPAASAGRIGLFAVAEADRGRGVGRALVAGALSWLAASGATTVDVATQGRNVEAQRLYQVAGFRTAALRLWYHRWSDA